MLVPTVMEVNIYEVPNPIISPKREVYKEGGGQLTMNPFTHIHTHTPPPPPPPPPLQTHTEAQRAHTQKEEEEEERNKVTWEGKDESSEQISRQI